MSRIFYRTKKLVTALAATMAISLALWGLQLVCNERIVFSHTSGFYDDAFALELNSGLLYDIHYTLDGSEPTPESRKYQRGEPIQITDATQNPNVYTARTDLSTGYYRELLESYGYATRDYQTPDQRMDKCTVIRAAAFRNGQQIGESVIHVYFVGWQNRPEYDNAYIVSLVGEPDDLFGYENGIMVTGKAFDRYAEELIPANTFSEKWWRWDANYNYTGIQWERSANVTVFNLNRKKEMDQICGVRIHGNASRGFPLKGLRLYARQEYAGMDFFDVDWFGEEIRPSKFLLFSGGTDATRTVFLNMKDHMLTQLTGDLHFSTMQYIPCTLFINGEFWGFYQIAEHYNSKYVADHFGVHENNVVLVKDQEISEGSEADLQLYKDMEQFITQSNMSDEEMYRRACELIDMDSFIDYYALQIYIARHSDWPVLNTAMWRTAEKENSAYGDGRWRWMLYDVNSPSLAVHNEFYTDHDTLLRVLSSDPLFISLFSNLEFQKQFAERILYIADSVLSPEKCVSFMDDYYAHYLELTHNTNIRLFNDPNAEELQVYLDNLKHFFTGRPEQVRIMLENYLNPAVAPILD